MTTLTSEYGYALVAAASLGMHCYTQGFAVGKLRKKYGIKYPDNGNGRYSVNLSDDQWFKFNCAQRAHHNYLEALPMLITWCLIGGIYYPVYSATLGLCTIFGRQLYASGYRTHGPDGRRYGAGVSAIGHIGMFVMAIMSGLKFAQLIN
eukprot:NODE_326_length_10940_cov_0.392122.p7 type:complete len:149 gc:universal NODE_326_length_10940_cov_0.392122:3849-3403(-)